MNIINRIEGWAKEAPDKTAFHFRNGEISYGELWERSGRLANYLLINKDICDGQPIPVYGHKNIYMPVCFLACVRSGHPYVPIDTNMPEQRIRDIMESVGSPVILGADKLPFVPENVLTVGRDYLEEITSDNEEKDFCFSPEVPAEYNNGKDDVHYIIFTSGSTGKPKGVQITTGNLEAYLDWSVTLVDEEPGVFLNQAPFSFDLSVMDLYTGLATGSTIVSADRALTEDLGELMEYLKEQQPAYWVSTPSFADLCLGAPDFSGKTLSSLRKFLFCGEPFQKHTASRLLNRFPEADVINTYGPTETTVCVTAVKITSQMTESSGDLPVGITKPGTVIYAAGEDGQPLENGCEGELIICGDTVSPGYFKDPEKTAQAFFTLSDGTRAYRTGDKGYVDENGMVFCGGRMDGQVKLHGYRIELGDIEKNLQDLDGVENAAVFLVKNRGAGESLSACILQNSDTDTSYSLRKWIRQTLGQRLPAYMVPRKIVFFNEFPMTINGKLDKRKLGEMI